MGLIDNLETHENGKYIRVVDLRNALEGKKVVSKGQFMAVVERNLGYCTATERIHSFIDYIQEEAENYDYACQDCGMEIDQGRWEAGRELEIFMFDQSWVVARDKAIQGEEDEIS